MKNPKSNLDLGMKIQNVLDTASKKSAMKDYWIDNMYTTKASKKSNKDLPKLGKVYTGTDYGPPEDNKNA